MMHARLNLATIAIGVFCSAAVALGQGLEQQIRGLVGAAKLTDAQVGIAVIDCDTGDPLVTIESNRSMIPASNLKLVTSGVALSVLGPEFEFRTRFFVDGSRLVIKGDGDPALGDPKLLAERGWDVPQFIDLIVQAAQKASVRGITEVIVDDRIFDRESVHTAWPANQLNLWYCAPVSGINFHTNVLEIYARAGDRIGGPPLVSTQPAATWIQVDTSAARTAQQGASTLGAQQTPGELAMNWRLSGTYRVTDRSAQREPIEVTVREPGLMFGRLLADAITRAGMADAGVITRLANGGEEFSKQQEFAVVSTPISAVLNRCNVNSQNLYAEALLKRVAHEITGQPGSWTNGATVVRSKLQQVLGSDASDVRISDGSGLSRENRIAPITLARWLAAMQRDAGLGVPFYDSMAGVTEGRLQARFRDRRITNDVRAKTGFIRNVWCLSGYIRQQGPGVNGAGGRTIAFVIMVNDFKGGADKPRDLQEDVVEALDRWLTRQAPKPQPALGG
ncbi:MAG: D-alanyl-D-alanine carboxypeptidase/D-alanyl-D-alanine-endopeptidase [Phycisphaerales bacterium]|jgi:D-alanyl-D-alanine carboxypeptidase/D-alanyl-D-alanine-endopeptidase (penicillin-binding protein 4)|nr:D-alanyl-D-alanine carboxypeptidase/D-alanyl-D-alanine-endopeptidase [Phycisphaerales bacterium]